MSGGTAYGTVHALLEADRVRHVLLAVFSSAAHGMTRGTWTATEVPVFPRTGASTGYTPYNQAGNSVNIKWLLVWESTSTRTVWLGKAVPRVWLSVGERVSVTNAPTRYGRLSLTIDATTDSTFNANITLPTSFVPPPGGIKLRLRSPNFPKQRMAAVTVGGASWPSFNATEETVVFATIPKDPTILQHIVITFS